jgi:hypothetical protein
MGKRTNGAKTPKDKTGGKPKSNGSSATPGKAKSGAELYAEMVGRATLEVKLRAAVDKATDKELGIGTGNSVSGRDAKGRFDKGNPGGPGNPFASRVLFHRKVINECSTDEDTRIVWRALIRAAARGDVAAQKVYLEHTEGNLPREIKIEAVDGKQEPDQAYL